MTKWLRRLHLWIGLLLSAYGVLIGISGSILVFREDIHRLVYPQFHQGAAPTLQADPEQVLEKLRAQYPGWRPLSFTWPHDDIPYWMIFLLQGNAGREVYVDTASGEIVGEHDPKADWFGQVETLHNNLSFGRNGRLANGYGGVGLIFLSLSGLWLVWPRLRHLAWGKQLWRARDLHYAVGAASFLLLIALSFTGAYFTWGKYYVAAAHALLGHRTEPKLAQRSEQQTLPYGELLRRAQERFPGKEIHRAPIPDAKFPFRVSFREASFAEFHQVSSVTLDPRSGELLALEKLEQRPAGDSFVGWLSAFHFGAFGGRAIQILWALSGVALAVLSVSGVRIWWNALRR